MRPVRFGVYALSMRMDMISLIKQSFGADNSNPICKLFRINRQVASGGHLLMWRIHDAIRIKDKLQCTVFVYDKKLPDRYSLATSGTSTFSRAKQREVVCESLKKGLEIMIDSIAFATEPILASLSNLLGAHERISNPIPAILKVFA
ncbi:hypothetical protein HELRODRAFT_173511 [Helobdella robusta]|uniref:Uncharacterized protein n=1 Tax=Helobdella robusta TaxID=6412 RepID=T1F6X0_HELRO|nr:hypothetical protein HELRODRAFT_173511 [Helobdella robusta]ESO03809.1 hypothetical protein HELRODRAFT_173511 [Helobdella robusta]